MSDPAFLDTLVQDFADWLEAIPDCRAMLLFGSTARGGGDVYSDRDIQVIVTDREHEQYINWMRDYAPIWTLFKEHNVKRPLWGIMFRGGHKVHLSVTSVEDIEGDIASGAIVDEFRLGYQFILDKDTISTQFPIPKIPDYIPPTEIEFTECIHNIMYGTCIISKYLKRGDLWTALEAHSIERRFMLPMIEWYAHIHNPDEYTHYRGMHMKDWLDDETWQELHYIAGHFDEQDSWRALFALIDVYTRIARETATHLGYPYPETMIEEVTAYVKQLSELD